MPDHRKAMWVMYDFTFYELPRKEAIRKIIACGYTAREAIEQIREHEFYAEHGPSQ